MKKKRKPRKPLGWLYTLAVVVVGTYLRLYFHLKIDKKGIKGIKGPVIAVANHQSVLDFAITALAVWPIKMNYLVSTYYCNDKKLKFLLDLVGTIPKKQFVPDTSTILNTGRALSRGQSVFIFPEGQVGYYGSNVGIDESIGKFIKHFKVPVIVVKLRGGFLSNGKYSKKTFPARLEARSELLLSKDQVVQMEHNEIFKVVKEGIYYDDFEWQRERMIPSRKKRSTDGLQNILYRCPSCNTDFTMTPCEDRLFCSKCKYTVRQNKYGFFEPAGDTKDVVFDSVTDWFRMQQSEIKKEIENGMLPFSTHCKLMSTQKNSLGYCMRGEGFLTISHEGLFFDGLCDGEKFMESFPVTVQTAVTHDSGVWGIDFVGEDCNYAFCPDDSRIMIKIVEIYSMVRSMKSNITR